MYLDYNHDKPMALHPGVEGMQFVGRTGRFIPMRKPSEGGALYRIKDGKQFAVTGTKGHFWVEAETARNLKLSSIDLSYSDKLVDAAIAAIEKFGSFEEFTQIKEKS
jgi:hypothetical protein